MSLPCVGRPRLIGISSMRTGSTDAVGPLPYPAVSVSGFFREYLVLKEEEKKYQRGEK